MAVPCWMHQFSLKQWSLASLCQDERWLGNLWWSWYWLGYQCCLEGRQLGPIPATPLAKAWHAGVSCRASPSDMTNTVGKQKNLTTTNLILKVIDTLYWNFVFFESWIIIDRITILQKFDQYVLITWIDIFRWILSEIEVIYFNQ